MGFAKPIEQIFIKLSRYIYVSKRYYTMEKHYGLEYDKDEFVISYEIIGSNRMPQVTVIPLNER